MTLSWTQFPVFILFSFLSPHFLHVEMNVCTQGGNEEVVFSFAQHFPKDMTFDKQLYCSAWKF